MKKSFSLLELIFVITLISFIYMFFNFNPKQNDLSIVTQRLILYLKQTRYQALLDNKYENDSLWHKRRWTFKFFRCKKSVGGIYYSIYSDENKTGHPNQNEALLDPLTNKSIYSTNSCEEDISRSPYVLLTSKYEINNINISCNNTSSIGQLSFGSKGELYSKLSSKSNESSKYKVEDKCEITLFDNKNMKKSILIEGKTGFIYENPE